MTSEVPTEWRERPLGEVSTITSGQSPKGETIGEGIDGVPFHQGTRDFGDRYPTTRVRTSDPKRMTQAGDVLLSVRAPVGRVNRAPEQLAIGRGLFALRGDPGACTTDFLELLLRSVEADWSAHESAGSVFNNLSQKDLKSRTFPLPPLPEQRAIAEILGSLDDRINYLGHRIQLALKTMDVALLTAADSEARLGDVAEVIAGQSPPGETYNEVGDGDPFLQGSAQFKELVPVPEKWCTDPKKVAEAGDVLFSVRAPVGDVNLAVGKTVIGRGLAALRCDTPGLLSAAVRSCTQVWNMYDGEGTTFGSVNQKDLKATKVPWPSSTTTPAAKMPDQLLALALQAVRERDDLERTRDALLPELVSGRLRVDDVDGFLDRAGLA